MNKTCIYAIVKGGEESTAGRGDAEEEGLTVSGWQHSQVAPFSHPAESVKCFSNSTTSLMAF